MDPPRRGLHHYRVITEAGCNVLPCLRLGGHQERMLGLAKLVGDPGGYLVVAGECASQQGCCDAVLDARAVLPLSPGSIQAEIPQFRVTDPAVLEDLGDGVDPGAERVSLVAADQRH
jgi:hypothetical protein